LRSVALAALAAFVVAWGGYRFDFRRPVETLPDAEQTFVQAAPAPLRPLARWLAHVPVPAPALALGLAQVQLHGIGGHTAFLLGETSRHGWWNYFPVVFFYKTPLPLLILVLWGAGLLMRQRHERGLEILLIAVTIMALAMTAPLNIGVRHILPIYAPLSIVAGYAVVEIWRRSRDAFGRTALAGLLAWLLIGGAVEHPDYLPWFNELARPNPARVAVDSNLDWGQDILRLARVLREERIDHVYIVANNATRLPAHGIHAEWLAPYRPVQGWVVVGENWLAFSGDEYKWLNTYRPVRRIGKSLRLYFIP
jgi:hypothetical protein